MEFLAAIAVFASVFVFVLALSGGQAAMRSRLESLRTPSGEGAISTADLPLSKRIFGPTADVSVQAFKRLLPGAMLEGVQQRLLVAGEPMSLNGFLTLQLISTGTLLVLPFLLFIASGRAPNLLLFGLTAVFGIGGFLLPQMWLRQRVGQRQGRIIKSLPDSFDLITTSVEAGLGLDAALARVAEKVEGPFADELRRTLREIGMGRMRREALRELGERTGVPDLITFVNAVIQAEQMGTGIGALLRVQAEQLRVRRRQRAEEQAYKAPIKMLFPLVLCIFPTLFIVILGPAVITIMNDFPGGK